MAKNDYTCIVLFQEGTAKKWKYVHSLLGFKRFFDQKHSGWKYCNVYERRTSKFLTRFYPGQFVPPFIRGLMIIAMLFGASITSSPKPLNSTFNKLTFSYPGKKSEPLPFF